MTVQITRPEVEALIKQRLQSGTSKDAEDVICRLFTRRSHSRPAWSSSAVRQLSDSERSERRTGFRFEIKRSGNFAVRRAQRLDTKKLTL